MATARRSAAPARPARKAAPKPTPKARPAAEAAEAPAAPAKAAPAPAPKAPKEKPVRDSFTMPPAEYAVIAAIKQRALQLGHPAKKSEVLRAGLKTLAAMSDKVLLAALQAVPPLKTGRPSAKDKPRHKKG
jgi:hypothetical protein